MTYFNVLKDTLTYRNNFSEKGKALLTRISQLLDDTNISGEFFYSELRPVMFALNLFIIEWNIFRPFSYTAGSTKTVTWCHSHFETTVNYVLATESQHNSHTCLNIFISDLLQTNTTKNTCLYLRYKPRCTATIVC